MPLFGGNILNLLLVLLLPAEPIYSESNLQIISQLMKCWKSWYPKSLLINSLNYQ